MDTKKSPEDPWPPANLIWEAIKQIRKQQRPQYLNRAVRKYRKNPRAFNEYLVKQFHNPELPWIKKTFDENRKRLLAKALGLPPS